MTRMIRPCDRAVIQRKPPLHGEAPPLEQQGAAHNEDKNDDSDGAPALKWFTTKRKRATLERLIWIQRDGELWNRAGRAR
jgi:hypothetical protein